jgi:hypothetical protein
MTICAAAGERGEARDRLAEPPPAMHVVPVEAMAKVMSAPTAVREALRSALPTLSPRTWAILDALVTSDASTASARAAARRQGLRDRFALRRLLRADGLPPPHALGEWVRLLLWVSAYQEHPVSLLRLARHYHKNPAVCYRAVKRLTGLHWTDVRARRLDLVLRALLRRARGADHRASDVQQL